MQFIKAHAYGNDFLYVKKDAARGLSPEALARAICDRHRGIGADGLILYERTPDGALMQLFNADGSRAEVSGNGVRALGALLLKDEGRLQTGLTIHTDAVVYAGIFDTGQVAELKLAKGRHAWVQVTRGRAKVGGRELRSGDGAALSDEPLVRIEGVDHAEVLVFDLA